MIVQFFSEGEVAVLKTHTTVPDDFLDSEKPIRSDWPSVFVSECFVEGEKAKLHGSARPLKTFLPPSIVFRSAADMDDDLPEPELPSSNALGPETGLEIVSVNDGLAIRKTKESDGTVGKFHHLSYFSLNFALHFGAIRMNFEIFLIIGVKFNVLKLNSLGRCEIYGKVYRRF